LKTKLRKLLDIVSTKDSKNIIDKSLLYALYKYKKFIYHINNHDVKSMIKSNIYVRILRRSVPGQKLVFVTTEDLLYWTNEWIKQIPNKFDIIVGIPRSGLLVANLIALRFGRPLTTPSLLLDGVFWASDKLKVDGQIKEILLVDDSILTGQSYENSLKLLSCFPGAKISKAALITTKEHCDNLDYYYKIISKRRIFEWNLAHAKKMRIVSDLDGVICENCPPCVDGYEIEYLNWINNAKPYLLPHFEIDAIISCRLEKYRVQTENWLKKHGVLYKNLILWDLPAKSQRQGRNAFFKIEHINLINPGIIWESSLSEAEIIWKKTKIPTLCTDEMIMFS
jgi:orotate phosphoribosyltransferase